MTIKEFNYQSGGSLTLSLTSGLSTYESSHHITGKILSVDVLTNTTGSLFLTTSGVGVEIFRRNAPSGTSWTHSRPSEFTQATTGSIAGALHVPFLVNEPIILSVNGAPSGTTLTTAQVKVRYCSD